MRYFSIITLMLLMGCSVNYSFTSTSQPTEAKSISIPVFYNESTGGPPNLSQFFTEKIRDYYQNNTKLDIVPTNGDLELEGTITGYDVRPVAPTQSANVEVSALTRLTIRVQASYSNPNNEKDNFNQAFSFFSDFDASKSLSDVEDELIDEITDQIIIKIFTQSFDNW